MSERDRIRNGQWKRRENVISRTVRICEANKIEELDFILRNHNKPAKWSFVDESLLLRNRVFK